MSDNTEVYYAEMEAARNSACDAYFEARPYLERDSERAQYKALFYAGFERAFAMLWHGGVAAQETPAAPPSEFSALAGSHPAVCKHCGQRWSDHIHTDGESTCPTANR